MADGIGCKCCASSAYECCCDDVDWTPQETIDLRQQLEAARISSDNWRTECEEQAKQLAEQAALIEKCREALSLISARFIGWHTVADDTLTVIEKEQKK